MLHQRNNIIITWKSFEVLVISQNYMTPQGKDVSDIPAEVKSNKSYDHLKEIHVEKFLNPIYLGVQEMQYLCTLTPD